MAPRISRLERITNLVLALLETSRPLSLREIGGAVAGYPPEPGALRQAFERDKRTLRDNGIPVAVERIDGEEQAGYRIRPEDYYLADLDLSSEEAEALVFALAAVRLEGASPGDVAQKLGAPAPEAPPLALLPSLPALGLLQQAIRDRAKVTFKYHDRPRRVAGYGLVFREGCWYLLGEDEGAGALRTFRVDRVEGLPEAAEPGEYEVPADFDLAAEMRFSPFRGEGATEVVLEADVRVAAALRDAFGSVARAVPGEDGTVEFSFRTGDEAGLVGFLLGYGDDVLVRSPESVVEQMVAALEGAK